MNRTFKCKLIQFVVEVLSDKIRRQLGDGQSFIIDYQGHPLRYSKASDTAEPLEGLAPLGESDVKFPRYCEEFRSIQIDSIDGDSIPIALLHAETRRHGNISILRLLTKVQEPKATVAGAAAAAVPAKPKRVYEFVNVGMLHSQLVGKVIPRTEASTGHEMRLLLVLIAISGTDFTRGLPQISGKTLYGMIPSLWSRLARAYDAEAQQVKNHESWFYSTQSSNNDLDFSRWIPTGSWISSWPTRTTRSSSGTRARGASRPSSRHSSAQSSQSAPRSRSPPGNGWSAPHRTPTGCCATGSSSGSRTPPRSASDTSRGSTGCSSLAE